VPRSELYRLGDNIAIVYLFEYATDSIPYLVAMPLIDSFGIGERDIVVLMSINGMETVARSRADLRREINLVSVVRHRLDVRE